MNSHLHNDLVSLNKRLDVLRDKRTKLEAQREAQLASFTSNLQKLNELGGYSFDLATADGGLGGLLEELKKLQVEVESDLQSRIEAATKIADYLESGDYTKANELISNQPPLFSDEVLEVEPEIEATPQPTIDLEDLLKNQGFTL